MEEGTEGIILIDFIKNIKAFYSELKKKWFFVSLFVCLTSVLGLLFSIYSKKYSATTTMMLENTTGGGGMSGALALASQFGLMTGGSASSVINEEKFVEIIKSETILKTALFKKATINSKSDILANHFIDLFGYNEKWENNDSLKGFRFVNTEENLTVLENGVLKNFCLEITKKHLIIEKSKSEIISVTTKSKSELFSKFFNQYLVEAITSFYINRITEKGQLNLKMIQHRVDSAAIALKSAESALARWKDSNFHLVKAQGMMAEMDLRRNVEVSNSIYIEGIKQLEISKFTLLQDTPFLQIIDKPALPLEVVGVSPIRGIVFGFVIGFMISGLYIIGRKKYSDLMLGTH